MYLSMPPSFPTATGYPAHVMFHGYKRRTQISTNAIKIYFDDVCSISEKLYDRNEGYFTGEIIIIIMKPIYIALHPATRQALSALQ